MIDLAARKPTAARGTQNAGAAALAHPEAVPGVAGAPSTSAADAPPERCKEVMRPRSRGWLVRRVLVAADLLGLMLAFVLADAIFGSPGAHHDVVAPLAEFLVFVAMLPAWFLVARLKGLYDRDEEYADHSTVDEFAGVVEVVTLGAWGVVVAMWTTGLVDPSPARVVTFWLSAIAFVALGRALARTAARRSVNYLQNTIIVGAGEVGQLLARKVVQHPEYGINLVGFVDDRPRERRPELEHVALLGAPEDLPQLVDVLDVNRVIVAFSNDADTRTLEIARLLKGTDLQIDVVPRLFELVGPRVRVHTVEGLSLLGIPPTRPSPTARVAKRAIDIAGASLLLLATAPLFAVIAWRIKRDSPGPVLFRQTRLGRDMREFTALKFRTMNVDTDPAEHREYMRAIMSAAAPTGGNGIYKLDRSACVTRVGRFLRKTSLDELPQLLNVVRGDMSLVGPRPCLAYETENFQPHHFERFRVPAGLTGLWQVTARAHSSFGEALEMDVAYARGWSLGLDLRLLLRTPLQVVRQHGGTA